MKSFVYLLNAGFREFVRDRTAVFFTLVFPIMFILVFGLFFGSQDDTGAYPVGVVLEDEDDQAALGFFCMFEISSCAPPGSNRHRPLGCRQPVGYSKPMQRPNQAKIPGLPQDCRSTFFVAPWTKS
jgi:hypothetical protein